MGLFYHCPIMGERGRLFSTKPGCAAARTVASTYESTTAKSVWVGTSQSLTSRAAAAWLGTFQLPDSYLRLSGTVWLSGRTNGLQAAFRIGHFLKCPIFLLWAESTAYGSHFIRDVYGTFD